MIANLNVAVLNMPSTGGGGIPVTGYKLWLDATDSSTITASGSAVSQWSDKSGNASNFTQGTGSSQPLTGTRTINGKNVIDFDGTNDFLKCPSSTSIFKYLHTSTGGTVFVVGINDSNGVFLSNGGAASDKIGIYHGISSNTTDLLITNGATVVGAQFGLTNVGTSAFYLTNKWDGGNATAANRLKESKNGAAFTGSNTATATASTSNSSWDMHLGSSVDNTGTPSSYFNGAIGEVIFYEGILSAGDITSVQSYLATKWGI